MKQQEIKRLLFIVITLWSATIGMHAQTPATISAEDYNNANQIAQNRYNNRMHTVFPFLLFQDTDWQSSD